MQEMLEHQRRLEIKSIQASELFESHATIWQI